MASMTMTASFLGGSAAAKLPNATPRRSILVVKASKDSSSEGENMVIKSNNNNGRRELVMGVAAAAACSIAKVALADEPKKGTPEAKKKYAPVCVTNPTARICRN
ncbi:hypothetical protein Leryth_022056 [Lithospermum erythrorhizon]|nr:hypothetical protein Leryth_022056 [Lithospermum erythrorhizon]